MGAHQGLSDNFHDRPNWPLIPPSSIVEFYPDATLIIDSHGRVVAWNKAMEKMTGVPAGNMLGKGCYEYAIPFYGERKPMLVDMVGMPKDEICDRYSDIVVDGDRLEAIAIKAKLKGRDSVLWGVAARLYGLDGEPAGTIETVRDVTRQILMEGKLKESEEKYRLTTTLIKDCIITVNADGVINYVNPGGEEMLCEDAERIIGRHFTDFIADEYKGRVVAELNRGLPGEPIAPLEIEAVDGGGRRLHVELSGSGLAPGGESTVIIAIRDVSERRAAGRTAELARAKEQAELYLDLMGHDINNMNQVAMGYLETAIGSMRPEEPSYAFIARSLAVLQGSSGLIGSLRKAQEVAGKKLKLEAVNLDSVLSQVISEYSLVPGREVTIRYEPAEGYVMANQLLKDVFMNIVGNAIKHSAGPLDVEIRACRREDGGKCYLEVSIEDDGPGIPDGLKRSVFSRADRSPEATGGGLGLYIVKSLVEGFDGRVRVEDRVPGDHSKGCKFIVLLPSVD